MTDDLISRQDAIEAISNDIMGGLNYESILKKIPTVEAEPVRHGRWIFHRMDEDENGLYECSECHCGETHSPNVVVRYCWNCGARMDGEEEGKKSESNNKGL